MSDGDVSRAFGRWIETTLKSGFGTDADVFYGRVTRPDSAPLAIPYVVVWLIPATRRASRQSGQGHSPDLRAQLTGVGRDEDEVATVLDRAGWMILGQRPTIPGWNPGQVQEMPVYQPVTKNEDVWTVQGTPTYRSWAMFRCTVEPGTAPEVGS